MSRDRKGGGGEDVKGRDDVEMLVDGESAVIRQCWRREVCKSK